MTLLMEPWPVVWARHSTHLDHTLLRCLGVYQKAHRIQYVGPVDEQHPLHQAGPHPLPERGPAVAASASTVVVRFSTLSLEQALKSPGEWGSSLLYPAGPVEGLRDEGDH